MKILNLKRTMCALLACTMAFAATACSGGGSTAPSSSAGGTTPSSSAGGASSASGDAAAPDAAAGTSDTFIADRKITVRTFDEDIGLGVPDDQINNAVAQKIKELTGITMEIIYTSGPSSLEALTTAISAGDLPDAISYYLNDSTRPEYPVVLKAAREGMLTDIAPYLKEGKVFSKYYQEDYLPYDSYQNIIQRPEFNGATYHVHMRMKRTADIKEHDMRGGMYIQKSIVDQLGINPWEVTTQDELYDLLNKIKAGGFKDAFGNDITPLGPAYWGGGNGENVRQYVVQPYLVGNSFWEYSDGKVTHQIQTDSIMNMVSYVRKLLNEGLMHKEFFTMDAARTAEGALSYSFGIIEDVHSGMTKELFDKVEYVPLGPLVDKYGRNYYYTKGRSGYGAWSIPTTTKNPEEVVKFADFLASKEGKLLWQYGIEGVHYDMKDGKPYVKQEVLDKMETDPDYLRNENVWGGGSGSMWGSLFGRTDMDTFSDFGEIDYGENTNPDKYAKQEELNNYGLDKRPYDKKIIREGFEPNHYLTEFEEAGGNEDLRSMLLNTSYSSTLVQAFFAKSDDEAKKIIDSYRDQLNKAGLEDLEALILKACQETPDMIDIRSKEE